MPTNTTTKGKLRLDIKRLECTLFDGADASDRRAFCVHLFLMNLAAVANQQGSASLLQRHSSLQQVAPGSWPARLDGWDLPTEEAARASTENRDDRNSSASMRSLSRTSLYATLKAMTSQSEMLEVFFVRADADAAEARRHRREANVIVQVRMGGKGGTRLVLPACIESVDAATA